MRGSAESDPFNFICLSSLLMGAYVDEDRDRDRVYQILFEVCGVCLNFIDFIDFIDFLLLRGWAKERIRFRLKGNCLNPAHKSCAYPL